MQRPIDATTLRAEFTGNFNGGYYTVAEIKALIDTAPTLDKDTNVPGKWISVEERMPEIRHAVLVYTPHHKNIWAASMHEDGNWYIWSPSSSVSLDPRWFGPITHWMPLPEPPEVRE